jgi:DNA-binding IclR family transcriptional regulator
MTIEHPSPEELRHRVPAVARAASILDTLAEDAPRPIGPSELARRLSLPKSSVINICNALVDARLARRTPAGFALGVKLVELGGAYLSSVDLVREFLAVCGGRTETIQLAVLGDGPDVIYLARHEGQEPVRLVSDVGRHLPAHCTATGKALLAQLPDDDLRARLAAVEPLRTLTPASIASVEGVMDDVGRVRARGYAIDDEETANGAFCVAACVPAHALDERAALSITVLKAGLDDARVERLAVAVRDIADHLGRRLGAGGDWS